MQVEYNGIMYYGFGANTDIVTASVEAYIDCINKFKKLIVYEYSIKYGINMLFRL